jgi:hypothetical protein
VTPERRKEARARCEAAFNDDQPWKFTYTKLMEIAKQDLPDALDALDASDKETARLVQEIRCEATRLTGERREAITERDEALAEIARLKTKNAYLGGELTDSDLIVKIETIKELWPCRPPASDPRAIQAYDHIHGLIAEVKRLEEESANRLDEINRVTSQKTIALNERDAALAKVEQLRAALEYVDEWYYGEEIPWPGYCLNCNRDNEEGHAPDCQRQAALDMSICARCQSDTSGDILDKMCEGCGTNGLCKHCMAWHKTVCDDEEIEGDET